MQNASQTAVAGSWYYEADGARVGPRTADEMVALVKSGAVGYGTAVWTQGMAEWQQAERTALRQHLEQGTPPPLSGAHVKNGLVWTLAFAPLIGLMLEYFVAGMIQGDAGEQAAADGTYWYVTVILNIALSWLDERALKRAGHDTAKLKGFVWLIPVYLYQRARVLGQKPAYLFVWIAAFAATFFV